MKGWKAKRLPDNKKLRVVPLSMHSRMRKACDACSLRKVQCDGREPCSRCMSSSFECTFLKSRGKPGPKGPRKRTAEAIQVFQFNASTKKLALEERSTENQTSPREEISPTSLVLDDVYGYNGSVSSSDTDWTNSFIGSISLEAVQPPVSTRIHTSTIAHYLKIYGFRAYSIWPVFDVQEIVCHLLINEDDMELYGLATALCAASVAQFHTKCDDSQITKDYQAYAGLFAAESKRARISYDHRERMTIWSLLTSFFLHVYASNVGKKSTTTLLLSEAVTIAHIIGLHKGSYYENLDDDQQQYCLRVYWLLFISDRAHAFQREIPTIVQRATDLPILRPQPDKSISTNFVHLCTLFNNLDSAVNAKSPEVIAVTQKLLSQPFPAPATDNDANELQIADIVLTQQWMRVLLWQYSLSLTPLFSDHGSDGFSLAFPAEVARTALGLTSYLSLESIEAHGPGMGTKLFEITNSLADVLICVPSFTAGKDKGLDLRDVIFGLCRLLASFRGGDPAVVSLLAEKLVTSGVMLLDPRQAIAPIDESGDDDQDYHADRLL